MRRCSCCSPLSGQTCNACPPARQAVNLLLVREPSTDQGCYGTLSLQDREGLVANGYDFLLLAVSAFISKNFDRYAEASRSRAKCHRVSSIGNEDVLAEIVHLADTVEPTAIARIVAKVVVDPVERSPRRGWPHVLKKGLEAFSPFVAHGNTPATIFWKRIAIGIVAAIFSCIPSFIFLASHMAASRRMAVNGHLCRMYFGLLAAATEDRMFNKGLSIDGPFVAADAPDNPISILGFFLRPSDYGLKSKDAPGQIFSFPSHGSLKGCIA